MRIDNHLRDFEVYGEHGQEVYLKHVGCNNHVEIGFYHQLDDLITLAMNHICPPANWKKLGKFDWSTGK